MGMYLYAIAPAWRQLTIFFRPHNPFAQKSILWS